MIITRSYADPVPPPRPVNAVVVSFTPQEFNDLQLIAKWLQSGGNHSFHAADMPTNNRQAVIAALAVA